MKSSLLRLTARLDAQALEIQRLRKALDIQFTRIAQVQMELDLLPATREQRRKTLAAVLEQARARRGNGTHVRLQKFTLH